MCRSLKCPTTGKEHGHADSETLCRHEVSCFKRLFPDMGNANKLHMKKTRSQAICNKISNFVKIHMYVCLYTTQICFYIQILGRYSPRYQSQVVLIWRIFSIF